MSGGKVDDAQTAVPEKGDSVSPQAAIVGAAVAEKARHPRQRRLVAISF
jgi:hypothetical protein